MRRDIFLSGENTDPEKRGSEKVLLSFHWRGKEQACARKKEKKRSETEAGETERGTWRKESEEEGWSGKSLSGYGKKFLIV